MAAKFVRVYNEASNSDVTVPRATAVGRGLKILDKPAVNRYGKPLPPKKHLGAPKNAPRNGGKADEATSNTEANKEATS